MAKDKGDDKKAKKPKKGKQGEVTEQGAATITLRSHPAAMAGIRRTRAVGGLSVFALVLALCLHAGVPGADALGRALVAGLVGQLVAWKVAQAVWRQIVLAQVRAVGEARAERRRTILEKAEEQRAARDASHAVS